MRAQDLQKYEGGSVPPDNVAKRIEEGTQDRDHGRGRE